MRRSAKTKYYVTLFIFSLSLVIGLAGSVFGTTIATNQYWILTDGYRGDFSNNRYIYVSYSNFLPYITEQVYHIEYSGTSGPLQKYDSSGKLLQYGYRWQTGSGYCVVDPPAQFLPASMDTGKTYTAGWSRKEYNDSNIYLGDGSDSLTITVSGPEYVPVPAGTFTAYKLYVVDNWRNSSGTTGSSISEYWLAKGVGWVKLIRDGVIFELRSATPIAATGLANSISTNSATLNGTVNPVGSATTYYFEYGPTASYGMRTESVGAGSGTSDIAVTAAVTDLTPATTYHFRVRASNSSGTSYGNDQTFTTLSDVPAVATGSATSLTSSAATLNGTVNPCGDATTYYFEYGTTANYGMSTENSSAGSGTNDIAVSANLTDLTPATTYHFRVQASNSSGTSYGNDQTFITVTGEPEVTTGSATSLTSSSATLNGVVNPKGVNTNYYFEYGLTDSYENSTPSLSAGWGTKDVSVSSEVTGLDSDATYHYRIVGSNIYGTSYGEDKTFTSSVLYVDPLGTCGGNTPCYTTIQDAVNAAPDNATIKIAEGNYDELLTLNTNGTIVFQGGWDSEFTTQSSNATIRAPMVLSDGEIRMKNIRVK